jgi:hypothetical protein
MMLADLLKISPAELYWLANQESHFSTDESQFKHYRCHWIKKRSHGWRLIEAPRPRLKSVQRSLVTHLFAKTAPHPLAYGFRTGYDVMDFVKPHLNRPVCLRLDLKDFFSVIPMPRVVGVVRKLGYRRHIAVLISLLATVKTSQRLAERERPTGFSFPSNWAKTYSRRHLPQGAPTSPAIANLCAYGLDVRLSALARSLGGVHYSRYADDILFSGDSDLARQADRLKPLIGAIAIEEGFEVNYRKWRLMRSSQKQIAAGIVMNSGANLDRKTFDRLKAILHNCVTRGPAGENRSGHAHFRQHLDGRIQWVERINPARGRKLRTIFEKIDW